MTSGDVQRWLDAYVAAWRSYDRSAIGELFSEDVSYRYKPFLDPVRGRDAVVASWLDDQDEPGSWEASYEPLLVQDDTAVITGESRYTSGRDFSNLWILRFDGDGRCREFVEWYMEHPKG